jgi:hypothetical protein
MRDRSPGSSSARAAASRMLCNGQDRTIGVVGATKAIHKTGAHERRTLGRWRHSCKYRAWFDSPTRSLKLRQVLCRFSDGEDDASLLRAIRLYKKAAGACFAVLVLNS